MADVEIPQAPEPRAVPQFMVGAASPLWAYFGAAAAGGLAYWWMTRWTRSVNLEAMFAPAAAAVEPMIEAIEDIAELPFAAMEAIAAPTIVLEPVTEIAPELAAASDAPVEAAPEAEPALEPEPLNVVLPVEAEAEPVVDAAAEPAEAKPEAYAWAEPEVTLGFEAAPEAPPPAPKPKARKATPPKG